MSAALAMAIALCSASALEVQLAAAPVAGEPVNMTLTQDGAPAAGIAVRAAYRQNAHKRLQHQQEIGTSSASGTLSWTPEEPGVVVLSWEGGSKNVSVRHNGAPISGLLIAILAGLLLLGGTGFFFSQMLRQE